RSLAWRSVWSRRSRVCHAERAACLAPAQLVGFQRALMPGGLLCAASGLETAVFDMHQPGLAFGCEFAGDGLRYEGPELLGMDGPAFEAAPFANLLAQSLRRHAPRRRQDVAMKIPLVALLAG